MMLQGDLSNLVSEIERRGTSGRLTTTIETDTRNTSFLKFATVVRDNQEDEFIFGDAVSDWCGFVRELLLKRSENRIHDRRIQLKFSRDGSAR
jgi:hypothetical protein